MTTLRYDGMRFGPYFESTQLNSSNEVENFGYKFSNIGALVIRFQLGQAQRAALLQEISLENYKLNPIGLPNAGNNQKGLFGPSQEASQTQVCTSKLAECAHGTLGVGKVLNERRQAQKNKNTMGIGGEALIWDILHTTVWQVGLNLASQLGKQGFVYIASPIHDDPKKHQGIKEALSRGEFSIKGGKVHVCGETLPTIEPAKLDITLNKNQFVISGKDKDDGIAEGALGWLMHRKKQEIVDSALVDDIIRVMKIAGGGFHRLTPEEQQFLQSGLVKDTHDTTVTQNAAFNGLILIAAELNKKYGFDPDKLFGNAFNLVYSRIKNYFKGNVSNLDDFLTGYLLNEMVQPLKTTLEKSKREEAPKNFINPFNFTANNNKALAYAFDIMDINQNCIFRPNSDQPIGKDPKLIDAAMNGTLALPTLSTGKHAGAILATGLLVGEQILLEQLLRKAYNTDTLEKLLVDIAGSESDKMHEAAAKLKTQISKVKHDKNGPVMGLQYAECEQIIETMRDAFKFNVLANFTEQLCQPDVKTRNVMHKNSVMTCGESYIPEEEIHPVIQEGLTNLYNLGNIIQNDQTTSAIGEDSRGINAGLTPLIMKLAPDFAMISGISLSDKEFWANEKLNLLISFKNYIFKNKSK